MNKQRLIVVAILYFMITVSAFWIFDNDDDVNGIPRIQIGENEYLANLSSGFSCNDIFSCTIWSNDSFSHNAFPDFDWIYHVNTSDRNLWNIPQYANESGNVTFDDVIANSFSGDGSLLTNLGLATETAVTISTKAGENIDKGQCVYISGAIGQVAQVKLCDNTNSGKHHAIGLSAESKITSQTMLVRIDGLITNLDTSMWIENATLYADNDGSLTSSYPTTGMVIQIADVIYSHASQGILLVHQHTPLDYLSSYAGGDINLRMGDSIGATCVEFENYTDGLVATVCSTGHATFPSMQVSIINSSSDIIYNAGSNNHYFGSDNTVGNSQNVYTLDLFTDDGGVSSWDISDNALYDIELLKNITIKNNYWDLSGIVKRNSSGAIIQSILNTFEVNLTDIRNITINESYTELREQFNFLTGKIELMGITLYRDVTYEETYFTGETINTTYLSTNELNGYFIGLLKAQQSMIDDLTSRIIQLEI